jgi:DNA-binding FadR family transcriptional regulator
MSALLGGNPAAPRKRNLCGQVVNELGLGIVCGDFKCGDTLPNEAELGHRFGVSRTVLREAIKTLAAKGLLETRARTGSRVRPQSEWNLLDPDVLGWRYYAMPAGDFYESLFVLRRVIEPAAAELAATTATTDDIAALVRAYDALLAADPRAEPAAAAADIDFHKTIIGACHNELLQQISKLIGVGLLTSFRISTDAYSVSLPQHGLVLAAIRDGDAARARVAMLDLLSCTHQSIDGEPRGSSDPAA